MKKRIIAVQLPNSTAGSTLILQQTLEVLSSSNEIHLFTRVVHGNEFQPTINGITQHTFYFKQYRSKVMNFLSLLLSHLFLFIKLLRFISNNDIVYLNSLSVSGAALAARFKKCKTVYHVHEINIWPAFIKKMICAVADNYTSHIIFVSGYAAQFYNFKNAKTTVIYNVLPHEFGLKAAGINCPNNKSPFTVSMICPLTPGKGVYEFIRIASKMPRIKFVLVLDASQKEIDRFIEEVNPAGNCILIRKQEDILFVYAESHLVMNLSKPCECVTIFGMSILEAMSCGRPVIVPRASSVSELIDDGVEGFCLNAAYENSIIAAIGRLSSDVRMYNCFAAAAREKSLFFTQQKFSRAIAEVFDTAGSACVIKNENLLQFETGY